MATSVSVEMAGARLSRIFRAVRHIPAEACLSHDVFAGSECSGLPCRAAIANTRPKNISLAALNRLLVHPWPGNVRELQNVLMRAIVLSDRCEIELSDLNLPENGHAVEDQSFQTMKSRVVWQFEHDFLTSVLHAHRGNITRAALAAKKNRRAFWQLLRKHGLLPRARRA